MRIHGRAEAPWDHLFAFHVLDAPGAPSARSFETRLRRLAEPAARRGRADPSGAPLRWEGDGGRLILGRFLAPSEIQALLQAWNAPDGHVAFMGFTPNHGFATLRDGRIDWWTEICFQTAGAALLGPLAATGGAGDRLLPRNFLAPNGLEKTLLSLLPERDFPIRS